MSFSIKKRESPKTKFESLLQLTHRNTLLFSQKTGFNNSLNPFK